ncbi:hypothetical protein [Rhodococcus sp. NPDC057529]
MTALVAVADAGSVNLNSTSSLNVRAAAPPEGGLDVGGGGAS